MIKARLVRNEREFVTKGTEISLGKFVLEHFTSLTLVIQTEVVSVEDTYEIWETVREDTIENVRGKQE